MYLYSLSLAFLIYVQVRMVREKKLFANKLRKKFAKECSVDVTLEPMNGNAPDEDRNENSRPTSPNDSLVKAALPSENDDQDDNYEIPFTQSASGVNFYLRLGSIGKTIFNVLSLFLTT